MEFIPIKTRPLLPPQESIYPILDEYLPTLVNGDIVLITSKILAIHQGRCVPMEGNNKDQLAIQEAESYIPRDNSIPHAILLTIKDSTLIASAGIDESNANGYYILWPQNTNVLLKEIWEYLRKKHNIKNLGVISTDSHCIPLRFGVTGISTGFFGFYPLYDYRGQEDIFGRKLKMTQSNIPDSLSAIAVFMMGEGNEQTPIVIARNVAKIQFSETDTYKDFIIPPDEDLFKPILGNFIKK